MAALTIFIVKRTGSNTHRSVFGDSKVGPNRTVID